MRLIYSMVTAMAYMSATAANPDVPEKEPTFFNLLPGKLTDLVTEAEAILGMGDNSQVAANARRIIILCRAFSELADAASEEFDILHKRIDALEKPAPAAVDEFKQSHPSLFVETHTPAPHDPAGKGPDVV